MAGYFLWRSRPAKRPSFTITSVLTLALCIGANTAIFSVVDAVLLRPLPYPQPERLAGVITKIRGRGTEGTQDRQTGSIWFAVREHATDLDRAVYSDTSKGVNLAVRGKAQYVQQQRVSAGFFRVLGILPLMGREFTDEEDRAGGPEAAVLSYGLWQRAFARDPNILGTTITLLGQPFTVVGVMPAGFHTAAAATDVWTPLRATTTGEGSGANYAVVVRLKDGVTKANAELAVAGAAPLKALGWYPPDFSFNLQLEPLSRAWTTNLRKPLFMLWGSVVAVLLIGCVNIAGLLLARSSERTREIATRLAIGSGEGAVLRQLLAESVVLAAAGGIAGIALGDLALIGLKRLAVQSFDVWQEIRLDWQVLLVVGAVSLLTSLVFGFLPGLQASRIDIRAALSEAGGRGVAGGSHRMRRLLVVGEVTLGVMLLIGAGLLIRSFAYLEGLKPGFDPNHVITASVSLQDARYATAASVNRVFEQSLARIRELPGVEFAAVGLSLPYERALNGSFKRLDGPQAGTPGNITDIAYVTPEYFQALRIPVQRGRAFRAADTADSAGVAIVNEAFARKYLPKQDAVGSHIQSGGAREIVGVVGDVQQKPGWGANSPIAAVPTLYFPAAQIQSQSLQLLHTWFSPQWVVRTSAPLESVIAGMQGAMESVDPQLPFTGFKSMAEVQSGALAFQRLEAVLLGILSGLALVLAAVGIYGLIASSVVERTRELGIRMALGASMGQAMREVVAPGLTLALIGVAAGSLAAKFLTQVMRHLIWGVTPDDPLTFVTVGLVLLAVAGVASAIPALRILRLDPAQTLRHE